MFTAVDRDENFPTAGFVLRHVYVSHLDVVDCCRLLPTVADCKLVPVRACCYGIQQPPVVHARKASNARGRKHVDKKARPQAQVQDPRAQMHAFYFRQQGSGKKRHKVSKKLMLLEKRF